jgi:hypothetical protein
MGRRSGTGAILVASAGLLVTAASTRAQAEIGSPSKTTTPAAGAPVTTALPDVTTAPPTTVWPSTTTAVVTPTSSTSIAGPPTSIAGPATMVPTTIPATTPFDAFSFLSEFYRQLGIDPFTAAELGEQTALGSSADAFVFHEAGVAISILGHTSAPLPAYTVTAADPAVNVCRDDGRCEMFSDFVLANSLLTSFSLDGVPMIDRVSSFERETTVEALTIEASFAVRRPSDDLLSVVVLLAAAGGGITFGWEQTTYLDASGRQYPIDAVASQFPARMEDGDFDVAHVSFAGAQHGGQLVVPITTDVTGVATTIRIPVVVR